MFLWFSQMLYDHLKILMINEFDLKFNNNKFVGFGYFGIKNHWF